MSGNSLQFYFTSTNKISTASLGHTLWQLKHFEQSGPDAAAVIEAIFTKINLSDKTIEGEVMDKLNLNKICCRRHILTHVDIE